MRDYDVLHEAGESRMDIVARTPDNTVLWVDVTSWYPKGTGQGGLAAKEAEKRKRDTYAAPIEQHQGNRLVPFVVEMFGRFGPAAKTLLTDLARGAYGNCPSEEVHGRSAGLHGITPSRQAELWRQRIAVAVQRGNQLMVRAHSARTMSANSRGELRDTGDDSDDDDK